MYCKKCGKEVPEGHLLCIECAMQKDFVPEFAPKQEDENATVLLNEAPQNQVSPNQAPARPVPPNGGQPQAGQVNQVPPRPAPPQAGQPQAGQPQAGQANQAPARPVPPQAGQPQMNQVPPYQVPPRQVPPNGGQPVGPKPVKPPMSKKKKKILIGSIAGGAALLIGLIVILLFVFLKDTTIDLNKYVSVEFEGYDTVGYASSSFDVEKFLDDYNDKIKLKNEKKAFGISESDLYGLTGSSAASMLLTDCVDGYLDKESGLSNGDVVTYEWECNVEYAKERFGCELKYSDIEFTVENLEKAEVFDPFEGIEVVFEGVSPYGTAYVSSEPASDAADDLDYYLDIDSDLKNGDTVTVYISSYDDDVTNYCLTNYGKIPSSTEKTFTVEGLSNYIQSVSELSAENLAAMQTQAADVYNSHVAQSWEASTEQLLNFAYIGSYLLTSKDSYDAGNKLYLVYKVQVNNSYSNDEYSYSKNNCIYWYIMYEDICVSPDGQTNINITSYNTPSDSFTIESDNGGGWWSSYSWYYYGYSSLDELYRVVVTSNLDSYNHEDTVDESVAPTIEDAEVVVDNSQTQTEAGIIFADSSENKISNKKIKNLSDEELQLAINEIYARNGYIFKDETLGDYYSQYSWYVPTYESDQFSISIFNDVERDNVERMQKERDRRK